MPTLTRLTARQILDSRGNPTIETDAMLSDGTIGRASVPSGASTGTHESLELRDNNKDHFGGKGVLTAVSHVSHLIQPVLKNNDPYDQLGCDSELVLRDATPNLGKFGANAILSVSLALSKAAATSQKLPYYRYVHKLYTHLTKLHNPTVLTPSMKLPIPMFNVMNGGAHTNWQSTNFQEFMIVPHAAPNFKAAVEQGSEIYHALKSVLKETGYSTLLGDEGGFAPALKNDEEALELLVKAISLAGLKPGIDVSIALDPATSELYDKGVYHFKTNQTTKTTAQMIELWQSWVKDYPIMSIEDGLAEDDWQGWQQLRAKLPAQIMMVGDDLLVTNTRRIEQAINAKACNALLMKLNQIGTLSEAMLAMTMSRSAGWKVIVSHRSGETEDTSIADIAVGVGAEYVKMGAPARSERTAKYNQLLRIEEELTA